MLRKIIIVTCLTAVTATLVAVIETSDPLENPKFFDFPKSIDKWSGKEITMSDFVFQSIGSKYISMRNYTSPEKNLTVNLCLTWLDDRNLGFHEPTVCFKAQGNKIIDESKVKLPVGSGIDATSLIIERGGVQTLVLYFFDVAGIATTSHEDMRFKILLKRLGLQRGAATFVRLMTPISKSKNESKTILINFLKKIYPLLPEYTYLDKIN